VAFHVRFVETSRGARIAFSVEGNGPPLVVLPPWTSHLAGEMALSGHKPFHDLLTEAHTVVRYDRWGTGLSDRDRTDFAPERDIEILAELADHLKLRRFTLLGPSHGGPLAVTYAVRQPRRVSHLVLYGSRASALTSGHTWAALRELILANWPVAARSIAAVATRGSDPGDVDAFTDLLIMAAAPETTVALQDAAIRDELTDLLSKVAVPTLVLHRRDDKLVSANEAVQLAARIPGARLELVDGSAHIHTAGDAAALAVRICAFTSGGHRSPSAQLSSREAEVLALAAEGRSNAEIGDHLSISVRTVERHLLNAYTKLGVRGRTQAISWWLRHEPGHRTA
jgi:pimeloyl-ACP methyl ester carboxylesterase/DNA-binding CsgD family transcriptional regulator